MKVFKSIIDYRNHLREIRQKQVKIGLVPTMGALHEGHLSLISASKRQNDITICSLFVNPTQFNDKKDLENYPRDIGRDIDLLKEAGCDVLFAPETSEMYSNESTIKVNFGHLDDMMEGKNRPGHFNGVAVVVNKLFNIIQPDRAYFGQKDLQQTAIIKKFTQEFAHQIELVICPIIREESGLAMSSRNVLLSDSERQIAQNISKALSMACDKVVSDSVVASITAAKSFLTNIDAFEVEYFECVHADTFHPLDTYILQKTAFCVALKLGNVRLIDNMIV